MCGRFTSSQRREAIGERFEVAVPETYQHRFNLAPQQRALIVRKRDDERDAVMAKWGLLPHWAKDSKIAFKMINARAETLTEKPAYRSLLSRHRCLIPADGFYEWTVGNDGKKHPIHFHLPEYELFAFAGLWTRAPTRRQGRSSRAARSSPRRRTSWWLRCTTGCRSSSRPTLSGSGWIQRSLKSTPCRSSSRSLPS